MFRSFTPASKMEFTKHLPVRNGGAVLPSVTCRLPLWGRWNVSWWEIEWQKRERV
ncbi:MAG TPA: hypothetical protein VMV04_07910 [Thermodesulfobacteriota bacterium]|nr:hypothetical protein [Thermodesulfobacteriota bacterium]